MRIKAVAFLKAKLRLWLGSSHNAVGPAQRDTLTHFDHGASISTSNSDELPQPRAEPGASREAATCEARSSGPTSSFPATASLMAAQQQGVELAGLVALCCGNDAHWRVALLVAAGPSAERGGPHITTPAGHPTPPLRAAFVSRSLRTATARLPELDACNQYLACLRATLHTVGVSLEALAGAQEGQGGAALAAVVGEDAVQVSRLALTEGCGARTVLVVEHGGPSAEPFAGMVAAHAAQPTPPTHVPCSHDNQQLELAHLMLSAPGSLTTLCDELGHVVCQNPAAQRFSGELLARSGGGVSTTNYLQQLLQLEAPEVLQDLLRCVRAGTSWTACVVVPPALVAGPRAQHLLARASLPLSSSLMGSSASISMRMPKPQLARRGSRLALDKGASSRQASSQQVAHDALLPAGVLESLAGRPRREAAHQLALVGLSSSQSCTTVSGCAATSNSLATGTTSRSTLADPRSRLFNITTSGGMLSTTPRLTSLINRVPVVADEAFLLSSASATDELEADAAMAWLQDENSPAPVLTGSSLGPEMDDTEEEARLVLDDTAAGLDAAMPRSRRPPEATRRLVRSPSALDVTAPPTRGPARFHEVAVHPVQRSSTGDRLLLVVQHDVTEKVAFKRRLTRVSEACVGLLDAMLPRHVVEHLVATKALAPATGPAPPSGTNGRALDTMPLNGTDQPPLEELATKHDSVTLFFCDIVGFTAMSESVQPWRVMQFLNTLYSAYDSLADRFGLYKVETVGDCYVCAGGLVELDEEGKWNIVPNEEDPARQRAAASRHATAVFQFAQAVLAMAATSVMPNGQPLQLRVGIHSGPICSGVVGHRMPKYCLFGDSMNTTSRMETTALPCSIHLSQATYELLAAAGQHSQLESTGGLEIKGKGWMLTWRWVQPAALDLVQSFNSDGNGVLQAIGAAGLSTSSGACSASQQAAQLHTSASGCRDSSAHRLRAIFKAHAVAVEEISKLRKRAGPEVLRTTPSAATSAETAIAQSSPAPPGTPCAPSVTSRDSPTLGPAVPGPSWLPVLSVATTPPQHGRRPHAAGCDESPRLVGAVVLEPNQR